MLTQKQKSDWLENLKSGEFKQGKVEFYNQKKNEYCCLGVLCETVNIPLESQTTTHCDNYDGVKMFIGSETMSELINANDDSYRKGIRDYSAVIPIIEKLPTI